MTQKLSECAPAGAILLIAGFDLSNDNKRFIWNNTDENRTKIKYIYHTLNSMMNESTQIPIHQTQHDISKLLSSLNSLQSRV